MSIRWPRDRTGISGCCRRSASRSPADQALITAHLVALKKALTKYADKRAVADELKRGIAAKEKELEALKAK